MAQIEFDGYDITSAEIYCPFKHDGITPYQTATDDHPDDLYCYRATVELGSLLDWLARKVHHGS